MKLMSLLCSLLLALTLYMPKAQADVWTAVNQWNDQWEQNFSDWVLGNWTVDFFSRTHLPNGQSNPYYGIRADCADVVYSMRLIYAYENKLPFAFKDPTTARNKLITNEMSRWNRIASQEQRLRNFVNYVFDVVSTQSLPNDTYPVAVDRESIRSGGLIRTTKINHHSWTIKEIQAIGIPHLVFNSTVGRHSGPGLQERVSWPNPAWIFEGDFSPESEAGFRYWRPQEYILNAAWEVPGYSEEQFTIPLKSWQNVIQKKLALRQETDEQTLRRLFQQTCESAKSRVTAINDGVTYLRGLPAGACMDYATYDTYSTPNRDQRLFDDFAALRRAYKDVLKKNSGSSLKQDMISELHKLFPYIQLSAREETAKMQATGIDKASSCLVEYAPGKKLDLAEAKRRLFLGLFSNNPMDELEYRWGSLPSPSDRAKACTSWDLWKPDLKQAD